MAKDVAQLIKEATEAVTNVPDDLRAVAFQKAFDALAGVQSGGGLPAPPPAKKGHRSTGPGHKRQTPQASSDTNRSQLDQLDRTSHPKINQNATALANSLRVLQAAHDDLGIDGLSAPEIAHVLTDKFRCRITRRAVSLALNGAGRFVNRHKEGVSVIFKIMSGGEHYLSELDSGTAPGPAKSTKKKSKSAKKAMATKVDAGSTSPFGGTSKNKTNAKPKGAKKSSKKKSKSPGQKALLLELIKDGFFNKPKTLPQIIDELKHKYGRTLKPNEMSTPLLRLLRDKVLTRTKNSDNQYEYKNA